MTVKGCMPKIRYLDHKMKCCVCTQSLPSNAKIVIEKKDINFVVSNIGWVGCGSDMMVIVQIKNIKPSATTSKIVAVMERGTSCLIDLS